MLLTVDINASSITVNTEKIVLGNYLSIIATVYFFLTGSMLLKEIKAGGEVLKLSEVLHAATVLGVLVGPELNVGLGVLGAGVPALLEVSTDRVKSTLVERVTTVLAILRPETVKSPRRVLVAL